LIVAWQSCGPTAKPVPKYPFHWPTGDACIAERQVTRKDEGDLTQRRSTTVHDDQEGSGPTSAAARINAVPGSCSSFAQELLNS
jgi:hypothetical protein